LVGRWIAVVLVALEGTPALGKQVTGYGKDKDRLGVGRRRGARLGSYRCR
jgi:hypothetical protein